jgi:transcription elongation GreA/GreB family factor
MRFSFQWRGRCGRVFNRKTRRKIMDFTDLGPAMSAAEARDAKRKADTLEQRVEVLEERLAALANLFEEDRVNRAWASIARQNS